VGHAHRVSRPAGHASPAPVIFDGLPGVGKSAIASQLAKQLPATHLRIDTIEQAVIDATSLTNRWDRSATSSVTPSPRGRLGGDPTGAVRPQERASTRQ
jgi:replication-associated recombination protein RarA